MKRTDNPYTRTVNAFASMSEYWRKNGEGYQADYAAERWKEILAKEIAWDRCWERMNAACISAQQKVSK